MSTVDAEAITRRNPANVAQALQGSIPGTAVIDRGGAPGGETIDWQIRGNTTIGGTEPLVLIDGIEGDISEVNPSNIASVSVLKDASATAIYGSRAANGVVIVETKDPQAEGWTVSYDSYLGLDRLSQKPEQLGLEESLHIINQTFINNGGDPRYSEEEIQAYLDGPDTPEEQYENPPLWPWFDALFEPGPVQNHNLAAPGGTEDVSTRVNLLYSTQDGIAPNFGNDVKEVSLNSVFDVSERISVNGRLRYRRETQQQPSNMGGVYWSMWHSGIGAVPQYSDGTYGLTSTGANPLRDAEISGLWEETTDKLVANFEGELSLLDNLSYTMQFGGHMDIISQENFANEWETRDYMTGEVVQTSGNNSLYEYRNRFQNWTWRNLLNYDLSLGASVFEVLAGFEQTWEKARWADSYRQQFYNNDLRVLDAGSLENLDTGGNEENARLRSVFGRARYVYDERYIFEATARYDGSSYFAGADNQYSFFPSFSAAWRIGQESFWEPLQSTVSELKLRGSWGETGNNTVDPYTFFQGINLNTNYSFNNGVVRTASPGALVNRGLTWETTTQWNVGLDGELWQGLFGVTLDYWHKRTDGILLNVPIPDLIGLAGPPQNAGIVDNSGWEVALNHSNAISEDFNYHIEANLSNFHNEVVDLAQTGPLFLSGGTITQVGSSLNAVYGYQSLGLFQSEEEIASYPTYAGKEDTYPGDVKYADLNGDGEITPADRTVLGNLDPHYSFGLNTQVQFKNFDLGVLVQGVGQQNRFIAGANQECGNWQAIVLAVCGDYWTENNRDASIPRPQAYSTKNNQLSTQWLVDASYVKLKNVQLGYTLPASLTSAISAERLRVYVQGTDLLTLSEATKWGLDPELNSGRLNFYPQTSRYTLGVNLTF